jgi:hypothetical protein
MACVDVIYQSNEDTNLTMGDRVSYYAENMLAAKPVMKLVWLGMFTFAIMVGLSVLWNLGMFRFILIVITIIIIIIIIINMLMQVQQNSFSHLSVLLDAIVIFATRAETSSYCSVRHNKMFAGDRFLPGTQSVD